MKDKKMVLRFFTVPQWTQEQDYLRSQHNNGWKFKKVDWLCCYHFERCEPEDVKYQLDFNPEGINHKSEYVQMFSDCGWEYIQDFVGYSYFRKPVSEMQNQDEEIFCDDASRLDMMKRVFKGKMIPLIVMFLCVILPQIFVQNHNTHSKILYYVFVVLAVLYLILFSIFAYQFWKYKKSL